MKVLLSPSKTMNTEAWLDASWAGKFDWESPQYESEAGKVMDSLKKYAVKDVESLMKVSTKIATSTVERNEAYKKKVTKKCGKPALALYTGDVYQGIHEEDYTKAEWKRAHETLRIISGLYGIVRAGDLIQPYRLEMKTKLPVQKAEDLYAFWQPLLASGLEKELKINEPLINLASKEYASALKGLEDRTVDIVFKEKKGKDYKVVGILAKRARGVMANYIITQNVKTVEALKSFNEQGYQYRESLSSPQALVFVHG